MSRIAKKPVHIPEGVTVNIADAIISVSGPLGKLNVNNDNNVVIKEEEGNVKVDPVSDTMLSRARSGLMRSLIANMVEGVKTGFEKKLEIRGVGYKASMQGNDLLILSLGYSHDIYIEVPEGISLKIEKNVITISGADKQQVGQFASNIRALRKPEPYKGKGVRYHNENVRMKESAKK